MSSTLIVEDDHQLRRTMQMLLQAHGLDTEVVHNACDAMSLEAMHPFDLVVVDLGLPDLDGLELIRRLRAWSDVPVLVVTARATETDRRKALAAGATAFLTKPFDAAHLVAVARGLVVDALSAEPPMLEVSGTSVDFVNRRATRGDHQLRLGPVEWRLLEVFARSAGAYVDEARLVAAVAGGRPLSCDCLSVAGAVRRLNRALNPDPGHPGCISQEVQGFRLAPTA